MDNSRKKEGKKKDREKSIRAMENTKGMSETRFFGTQKPEQHTSGKTDLDDIERVNEDGREDSGAGGRE